MKIVRVIISLFLVFTVVFTFVVGVKKISSEKLERTEEYKGVLSLWQIDAFEGGIGSRKQFLMRVGSSFEKSNVGVLVMVSDHTIESANNKMADGIYPDMISFGVGVNVNNVSQLNVSNLTSGGMVGSSAYATCWCRGGYTLLSMNLEEEIPSTLTSLVVSQINYTNPLLALLLEGITSHNIEIRSPLDAYVDFISGKAEYMLGTQRDVIRLENRGIEIKSRPLTQYNDLYQYVSITTKDRLKAEYCKRFIEYLVSRESQAKLNGLGMMSPFYQTSFTNEHLSGISRLNGHKTISAFIKGEVILDLQRVAKRFFDGEKIDIDKIKNILV